MEERSQIEYMDSTKRTQIFMRGHELDHVSKEVVDLQRTLVKKSGYDQNIPCKILKNEESKKIRCILLK